ncbi:helix-turn-helix domain-containing protein [Kordia sp.]|uniref:helix-turn-helix domain-containing protein n=1 Tax=Kordia sp. TaxID=1965332 RepID=UPI003B59FB94
MNSQNVCTLINQQDGNLAFKLFSFNDTSHFDHLQRNNFYTLIWIKEGEGLLKVDFSEYTFKEETLFAFSPFQPFMFSTHKNIEGIAIQFHSDFYCIHRNPQETNCETILFNNIYQAPFFTVDEETAIKFDFLITQLKAEFSNNEEQNYELLVPNLKVFLGNASRAMAKSQIEKPTFTDAKTPFVLRNLKNEIESNFKEKHSASDYANLLHISSNALAKLVKSHYNKTLTQLITERILIEAKRELYMTSKPIKEIAWSLGYTDEFYFSRLFKTNTGISPQMYRDTVGFGRATLN